MLLTKEQISTSIEWLCASASPPVEYLTHRDLLQAAPESKKMQSLWHKVQSSEDAKEIFSKQRDDGSWFSGGTWAARPGYCQKGGYTPYSPKYATTIWLLTILGDMGFNMSDPRIVKACGFTVGFLHPDGTFGAFAKSYYKRKRLLDEPPNIPCHFAGYLMGLTKVGMGRDTRLDKSFDLLTRWQRDDGGWLNERHLTGKCSPYKVWTRSCPWVTYFACQALRNSGRAECREPYSRGLNFLAQHLAGKQAEELKRFYYHGHETVRELLMFAEEGTAVPDKVMATLLEWLRGMYDNRDGHSRYMGKPISKMSRRVEGHSSKEFKYRLYHMIEDDWLTYYTARISVALSGESLLQRS